MFKHTLSEGIAAGGIIKEYKSRVASDQKEMGAKGGGLDNSDIAYFSIWLTIKVLDVFSCRRF